MPLPKHDAVESLRHADTPFTLAMHQPYTLTIEELNNQVDLPLQQKKEKSLRALEFQSFDSGTLKMLNTNRQTSYVMTFAIEANKVHISCSCGNQVKTLCLHSYKALDHAMRLFKIFNFKDYMPAGLFDLATIHPDYFEKLDSYGGTSFMPKKNLGNVYQLTETRKGLEFSDLIQLPNVVPIDTPPPPRSMALAYIIMTTSEHKYLPFLSPCLCHLYRDAYTIKSFQHFLSGAAKEIQQYLPDEQSALNLLCNGLWQDVAKQPGSIIRRSTEDILPLIDIFDLWHMVWPLLVKQEFVYQFHFYNDQALKINPTKHNTWNRTPVAEKPVLQFVLKEKKAFYELHLKIKINGIPLKSFKADAVFFIKSGSDLYLLSSLRDAAIVEWMQTENGHLTIFKEHFAEFEKQHLNPLSENYSISLVPLKRKAKSLQFQQQ